jgi:hypothetical protein
MLSPFVSIISYKETVNYNSKVKSTYKRKKLITCSNSHLPHLNIYIYTRLKGDITEIRPILSAITSNKFK